MGSMLTLGLCHSKITFWLFFFVFVFCFCCDPTPQGARAYKNGPLPHCWDPDSFFLADLMGSSTWNGDWYKSGISMTSPYMMVFKSLIVWRVLENEASEETPRPLLEKMNSRYDWYEYEPLFWIILVIKGARHHYFFALSVSWIGCQCRRRRSELEGGFKLCH